MVCSLFSKQRCFYDLVVTIFYLVEGWMSINAAVL